MRTTISANRTFLMGLAMIAIILFHHGWTIIPGVTAFFSRFGLWGVDIFLFLSGFGCVYALNKYSRNTFWCKRIIRLLPTCLLAGIIVYVADIWLQAEMTCAWLPVRLLSLHRWYIQAILVCYALCPLFYIMILRYRAWALIVMSIVIWLIGSFVPEIEVFRLRWILDRIPVFLVGMYVAIFDLQLSKWQLAVLALSLAVAAMLRCGIVKIHWLSWTIFLAAAMPAICDMLARLSVLFKKLHLLKFVETCGIYSLEIYLIHEYAYWSIYTLDYSLWAKYSIFAVVVIALCFILKRTTDLINIQTLLKAWVGVR